MIRGGSPRRFQDVSLTLKEDVLLTFTKVIYKSVLPSVEVNSDMMIDRE
jgi:hypothetical protein